eukprot:11243577-Karenia_brevis.AAC.1
MDAVSIGLQPFLQIIESTDYIQEELGIANPNKLHSIWIWTHPKYSPTHVALYKNGDGVLISKGPRTWGPVN